MDFVKKKKSEMLISWTLKQKISVAFFVNVFLCKLLPKTWHKHLIKVFFAGALVILVCSWNSFHTLDITLHKKSFPHQKSCRLSFKCHVCGNGFKIECYSKKHLQKKQLIFFGSKFVISTFQKSFTKCKPSKNDKWKQ